MIALPMREWEVLTYMRENHKNKAVKLSALPKNWHRPLAALTSKELLIREEVPNVKGSTIVVLSAFNDEHYSTVKKSNGRCNETYRRKMK